MDIYLQGLTMGLAYVAPIGLQNLFVINTALTQPRSRVYAIIKVCQSTHKIKEVKHHGTENQEEENRTP